MQFLTFGLTGAAVESGQSDRDVFNAIVDLVAATGQFDAVTFGADEDVARLIASERRTCVIHASTGSEQMQAAPGRKLRVVDYLITIGVELNHEGDVDEANATLDRLGRVVRNALKNVEYRSYCLFEYSVLSSDTYKSGRIPECLSGTIRGRFAYVVDPAGYAPT